MSFFIIVKQVPASAVQGNAATPFSCEAPEMFLLTFPDFPLAREPVDVD